MQRHISDTRMFENDAFFLQSFGGIDGLNPIRIGIDAMGGDFAPRSEIRGAFDACCLINSTAVIIEVVFFGKSEVLSKELAALPKDKRFAYSVVDCEEVITMDDEPTEAFKKKKNSSLVQGLEHHTKSLVDAFISAGNTGAVMTAATLILGRLKGVQRPVIGSFFPSIRKEPVLLMDVGANVDSKSLYLYQFGVMGSVYFEEVIGTRNPKVGLLNVGEEPTKGNLLALEAFQKFSDSKSLNFIGNVEGRDILMANADVIVVDGFTGNIVLKFAESVITMLKKKIELFAGESFFNKLSVALMISPLKKILKNFDYQEHGGVPLLGVKGVVIIGHGKSTPLAIQNMIVRSLEVIRKDVNQRIELALEK